MTTLEERPQPVCTGCGRQPEDIDEYVLCGQESGLSPSEYVIKEEGTLNPVNHHFLCTSCYLKAGMPSSPYGWVAP